MYVSMYVYYLDRDNNFCKVIIIVSLKFSLDNAYSLSKIISFFLNENIVFDRNENQLFYFN